MGKEGHSKKTRTSGDVGFFCHMVTIAFVCCASCVGCISCVSFFSCNDIVVLLVAILSDCCDTVAYAE